MRLRTLFRTLFWLGLLGAFYEPQLAVAGLQWTATEVVSRPEQTDKFAVAEFAFKNAGDTSIWVTSLATTCKCTTATGETKSYAPGESGIVRAAVDRKIHPGRTEQTLIVATDDPQAPKTELKVKVIPKRPLTIEPERVEWRQREPLAPKRVQVDVDAKSPVQVLYLLPDGPGFTAELKTITRNERYEVTITPKEASAAATKATIMLKTDAPSTTEPYTIVAETVAGEPATVALPTTQPAGRAGEAAAPPR